MSAHLTRLQAFLVGAGDLEVVAPAPALRPDYFSRFARMLGATVVATHLITAAAAPAPAPGPAPEVAASASAPAGRDHTTTQASILSVQKIAARYLSHGRSPLKAQIVMLNPDETLDEGPAASAQDGEVCRVDGVRTDYSKADPQLAKMAGTPEMRAQVLVHESMHCRLGPALLRHVARFPSQSVSDFTVIFSESSADAMAVLTVARVDGVQAALTMLDQWSASRGAAAASPAADGQHDTRETLKRLRELLVTSPERVSSDGAAFSLAITEAIVGASKTFADALPPEHKGYLVSPEFRADMASFHQAVEEMASGYLEGAHDLGTPVITFNGETVTTVDSSKPAAWSLLATRHPAPAFTAAGLREQAVAITNSIIAGAGGVQNSTLADTRTLASQAGSAQSIGRLKSRLDSIYVNPVPVLAHLSQEHDKLTREEPGQPAL